MIELKSLHKHYKKHNVLNGISLTIEQGEIIGIIGGNGCGKSTLLSILAGVLKPDCGNIIYNGIEALRNNKIFTEYTGYVPQENPLIEELSVKDNLHLWYTYSGKAYKEHLQVGIVKSMGLTEYLDQKVNKLSGGMKKRLSIACALSNDPPVLLMDEPSAALDLIAKEEIHMYMKEFIRNGNTIIISTHDESELRLCSKLFVLKNGLLNEVSKELSVEELTKQFNDN